MDDFIKLKQEIVQFIKDRDWDKFHNPKDLAISLNLEAAELLECFQWKSNDDAVSKHRADMIKEIADIMIYCVLLSNKLDFDIVTAIRDKLEENGMKYPVSLAFGKSEKYDKLK